MLQATSLTHITSLGLPCRNIWAGPSIPCFLALPFRTIFVYITLFINVINLLRAFHLGTSGASPLPLHLPFLSALVLCPRPRSFLVCPLVPPVLPSGRSVARRIQSDSRHGTDPQDEEQHHSSGRSPGPLLVPSERPPQQASFGSGKIPELLNVPQRSTKSIELSTKAYTRRNKG